MPKMSITVPHQLGQAEALNRIQQLAGQLKTQYGNEISDLHEQWNGPDGQFSFKAMGFNVAGDIHVGNNSVDISGDLPMMAIPFKGQIEQRIQERAAALLA